jgi:hypothetical protein
VPDLRGNLGRFLATPEGRRFVPQVPGIANARMSVADEVRGARGAVPADATGERRRIVAALRERGLDVR